MEQTKKPTYRYCIVPMCRHTIRNAPDKVFFLVPRGADVRRQWCKIMKRDMISPSTCLYICEDHFDIEEDTDNYMEYKIMTFNEKQKTKLRLKKGILPHKFECQKDTEAPLLKKGVKKVDDPVSAPPAAQSGSASRSLLKHYSDTCTDSSSSHMYTEDTENKNTVSGTSLPNMYSKNKMYVDKAI